MNLHLPIVPSNLDKWPWLNKIDEFPSTSPDGRPWPKISIVTPSFNQAQYLEETIRSVLLQGYPNIEYIIIDGGSTDGSIEIIKKYEQWLSYWVSEKDNGQVDAIHKGFNRSTGIIGGWINSDDLYLPGAFHKVAGQFCQSSSNMQIISGKTILTDENLAKRTVAGGVDFSINNLKRGCILPQQSTFFSMQLFRKLGGLDNKYSLAFDYDFWLRASRIATVKVISEELAIWRLYQDIKSIKFRKAQIREAMQAVYREYGKIPGIWLGRYVNEFFPSLSIIKNRPHRISIIITRALFYYLGATYLKIRGCYED